MPLYFMYAPHGLRLHGILMPLRLAGRLWYPPRFDSGVRCLRHQLAVLTVARRDNRPFLGVPVMVVAGRCEAIPSFKPTQSCL
jgi:hypothetical protein